MHCWLILGVYKIQSNVLSHNPVLFNFRFDVLFDLGLECDLCSRCIHLELRFHAPQHGSSVSSPLSVKTG